MNRRLGIVAVVIVAILGEGAWVPARAEDAKKEAKEETYASIERLIQVLTKVRDNYVDPVSTDKLMDAAIRGMLRTLDPYSQYLDKEEAERLKPSTHGGIGASIGMRDGWVTVISASEGGPASRAGIRVGDRIMKIDGVSSEGLSLDDAMAKMLGDKGSKVALTLYREGRDKPIDLSVTRDVIAMKSVIYSGMLPNGVGYIRLANFSTSARQEIDDAFGEIDKQNPHGVVLDLRFNPGGLLSGVVEVAEEFTPKGKKIVYTRGRDPSQNRDFYSAAERTHSGYPIVVLVNQWTASGSEIIAGAIQDLDLGVIVGQTTFGQGTIQTVMPLTRSIEGPKLKLTTARFYTPSGRSIQREDRLEERTPIESGDAHGSSTSDASNAKKPLPEFHTESGRTVFGGGGIAPDIEIIDQHLPPVMEELETKQAFFKFAVEYTAHHKEVPANYALTPEMRGEFQAILKADGIEANTDSLAAAQRYVDLGMRRELARRYVNDDEAYRVMIEQDDQVREAASLIDRAPTLARLLALASELSKVKAATVRGDSNTR